MNVDGQLPGEVRAGRPLLTVAACRRAVIVLACCAIVIGSLGVLFAHQAQADWLDHAIDSPVIAWLGGHQELLRWLVAAGSPFGAVLLSIVVACGCLLAGRLNGAVLAAAAVPASAGLVEGVLKPLVHRTYMGGLSFPSGHVTAICALAATVTVLAAAGRRPARSGLGRVLIPAAGWILVAAVVIGVMGMRWHYFTDTVAGAAAGIGTVCGLALILDRPLARRWLAEADRRLPGGTAAAGTAGAAGAADPQPAAGRGRPSGRSGIGLPGPGES